MDPKAQPSIIRPSNVSPEEWKKARQVLGPDGLHIIEDEMALSVCPPTAAESPSEPDEYLNVFPRNSDHCLDGQISNQSGSRAACGGSADIWTGLLQGQTVAIKVLRPCSKDAAIPGSKLRKVCYAHNSLFIRVTDLSYL